MEERIAEWLWEDRENRLSSWKEWVEYGSKTTELEVARYRAKAKELISLIFDDNQELPSVKSYENWVDKVKEAGWRKVRE